METAELRPAISLKHILVATDFSGISKVALRHAAAIAARHGSDLHITHVIPTVSQSFIPIEPVPPELDLERKQANREMAEFVADENLTHIRHQELLVQGEICDVLAELVREQEIDLLVLGTHGRGGIKTILLGSVAEEVFRRISCPVLTIGPAAPAEPRNAGHVHQILFATDFGPASQSALPHAIAMARDDNAKLILLHILAVLPALDADTRWYSRVEPIEWREATRQKTVELLKQLIPADANLPCDPEFVVACDLLPRGILNAAEERQADLIVMGVNPTMFVRTSTHIPWAVAHEVVQHAKCPVLTVRSEAAA